VNEEDLQKQIELLVKDDERSQQTIINQRQEIERLNNIINKTIKYVESLSSCGRGCDIYDDIKQEILKELKGSNGAIPPEVIGTNGEDGGLFDYGDR